MQRRILYKIIENLGIGLLFLIIFCLISYPLTFDLSSLALGTNQGDTNAFLWNAYAFRNEVLNANNPFQTNLLFAPNGVKLWMHTYTPIIGFINIFVNNPYLSCNLYIVLNFILAGVGAYLLACQFLNHKLLSFIAAIFFVFSPYMTSHLQMHYNLILVWTVPFFLLHCFRLNESFIKKKVILNREFWRSVTKMTLLFIITFFSDYNVSFFLIFLVLGILIFRFIVEPIRNRFGWKSILLLAFVVVLVHITNEIFSINSIDKKGAYFNTPDLIDLFRPMPHLLVADFLTFKSSGEIFVDKGVFIGYLFFILIIISLFSKKPGSEKVKLLGFLVLFFLLLTFPKIRFLKNTLTFSPTSLYHYIPVINHLRNPGRMMAMVYLLLPIYALYRLKSIELFNKRLYLLTILFIISLFEYVPKPYSLIGKEEPKYLDALNNNKKIQVILTLPTGVSDGYNQCGVFPNEQLRYQIIHQKKLVGGYISRVNDSVFRSFKNNTVLSKAAIGSLDIKAKAWNNFKKEYQVDAIILTKESYSKNKNYIKRLEPYFQLIDYPSDQEVVVFW